MKNELRDKDFLDWELKNGIGFHNPGFKELAKSTVRQLAELDYLTVFDYGCGTGVYADAFQKVGKAVAVWDLFPAHLEYVKKNAPELVIAKRPFTTDLLLWIEVAEHMTDVEIDNLLSKINPKYILFSSTSKRTEWDENWGHINIKEQADWIQLFSRYGYKLKRELSAPTAWAKLFESENQQNGNN